MYEMNAGIVDAVRQLQRSGDPDAVAIYCSAPFAYSAIWREHPDWDYFKNCLHNTVEAGVRRGRDANEVIDTFCSLCMIDPKLAIPMIA